MPPLDFEIISIHDSSDEECNNPSPLASLGLSSQRLSPQPESEEDTDDEPRAALRNPRSSRKVREDLVNIYASESESEFEESWAKEPPVPNFRGRETFRKLLEAMEDQDDIDLLFPKSLHPTFRYDEALVDELQTLLDFVPSRTPSFVSEDESGPTFEQLEMEDFSVYRCISHGKGMNGQFEHIHIVSSEQKSGKFHIDGVVSHGTESRHVIGAVIDDVNIGGLDDIGTHTTAGQIWVRTKHSRLRADCWYRLSTPASEYADCFYDFLWLADLNKHLIDYLCDACDRDVKIRLHHFESAFFSTLCSWHGDDQSFTSWSRRSACTDFRLHITMHASFLRDQAWSVSDQADFHKDLRSHPIWDEVAAGTFTEDQQTTSKEERTVVTPNIGSVFTSAFPQWGPRKYDLLHPVAIHSNVQKYRATRRLNLQLPDKLSSLESLAMSTPDVSLLLAQAATTNQRTTLKARRLIGEVVVVRLSQIEQQYRFAFVKEVTNSNKTVKVVWLTLPENTICGSHDEKTFYPVKNELFLSNACNCAPVPLSKIVAAHEACVIPEERYSTDKIVIQLQYREAGDDFVAPNWSELLCSCQAESKREAASLKSQQQSQKSVPKLRNMSLFSGCGLLDFGLEESGAFETIFAIDHSESSIRSHAANSTSKHCSHIVGSVNSYLERWIRGEATLLDIDCITAGCPCQGFSRLNVHRFGINGQRNCSLLASTLSWVELYLPKFVLIENVPAMDHTPSNPSLANACGQAVCCLVSMGYQVRKTVLNAYEHGSPTTRKRLFLIAAAPTMHLPEAPVASHGHDHDLEPITTVSDVVQGLSSIHNDTVINVQDPTHVPAQRLKSMFKNRVSLRNILKRIPKGSGHGLIQTCQDGLLSQNQRIWVSELSEEQQRPSSRSLTRINATIPFRTIVTAICPLDCRFGGMIVHPYQDRLLSLKEIRRAQGIPDWFLLVGDLAQQIKQIGNGVAWQVAAALGRSIGDAWRASCDRVGEEAGEMRGIGWTNAHLPNKPITSFKETSDPACGKEQFHNENEVVWEGWSIESLSDGDSIEVLVPKSVSPATEPEGDGHLDRTVSIRPKAKYLRDVGIPKTIPSPDLVRRSDCQSPPENLDEISEQESPSEGADGCTTYERNRQGHIRDSTIYARKTDSIVVRIPSRKRTGSPTPSSPPLTPKAKNPGTPDESDSDSDIVFVETRPILKRSRRA